MASAELSRRVEKVVAYPPLCDMGDSQRREFHEALLEADSRGLAGEVAGGDLGGGAEPTRPSPCQRRLMPRSRGRSLSGRANIFVTAQGGDYSQFRRALERRNFILAWTLANELPRLPRDDALALLLLARDYDQDRFIRAAPRWHARLCAEEALDLDESQIALAALNGLRDARRPISAQVLTDLFEIHRLEKELEVLKRWLDHPEGR